MVPQSKFERIKDIIIYVPIGIYGLVKNNASTVIELLISQAKPESNTIQEKVSNDLLTDDQDSASNTTSNLFTKYLKPGIDDVLIDYRKNRKVLDGAVGSLSIFRDNFSTFGKVAQNRGKQEIQNISQDVKGVVVPLKTSKDIEIEEPVENQLTKIQNFGMTLVSKSIGTALLVGNAGFKMSCGALNRVNEALSVTKNQTILDSDSDSDAQKPK